MIEIFEGRLGGGKTYTAVVRAMQKWVRGGHVSSNVEFDWAACKSYAARKFQVELEDDQNLYLTDDQIAEFHRFTPSGTDAEKALVIVDEAHLNFNSRDWSKTPRDTLRFLTQSRKVDTDIIFISQSALNIDKQFHRLVLSVWRFRDMTTWRLPGLGIPWPFKQILACRYDYDGRTLLHKEFVNKDPEIFALYRTKALVQKFSRLNDVVTARKLKRVSPKKDPKQMLKFLVIVIVALVGGAWFLQHSGGKTLANPLGVLTASAAPPPGGARPLRDRPGSLSAAVAGQAAYDIYSEDFVAWWGPEKTLHTAEGWYQLGEMSHRGYVTAVSDRRVRVAQPNGRTGWVVPSAARPAFAPAAVLGEQTLARVASGAAQPAGVTLPAPAPSAAAVAPPRPPSVGPGGVLGAAGAGLYAPASTSGRPAGGGASLSGARR